MVKYRSHSIAFKRQVAEEYLAGETVHGLAKTHDITRNLIGIWVAKHEAGEFEEEKKTSLRRIAFRNTKRKSPPLSEWWAGSPWSSTFKGGLEKQTVGARREYVDRRRPDGLSVARGCKLMNLARSSYCEEPAAQPIADAAIVERIGDICAEFPHYGYRRVTAQLRRDGLRVNHKKAMRLMREHDLTVRPRRRWVATTDSNHDGPTSQIWQKACCQPHPTSSGSPI